MSRVPAIGSVTLLVTSLAGVLAFAFPFIVSVFSAGPVANDARTVEASLLLALVIGGALVIAVADIAQPSVSANTSRSVALLGVLVAIDATLRLVPSFLGASPIFALIVIVGYVYGPRFGFVMGALTLLLSAAITAGLGPWLPFQMLCAGWVGATAGWLPASRSAWIDLGMVAAAGALWGFAYGALMNLYSWPYVAAGTTVDAGLYWSPGLSFAESIERYATFYMATSLVHDATRAAATATLILIAGVPVLRLLRRFRDRMGWIASV